jgi:hypothetical protein
VPAWLRRDGWSGITSVIGHLADQTASILGAEMRWTEKEDVPELYTQTWPKRSACENYWYWPRQNLPTCPASSLLKPHFAPWAGWPGSQSTAGRLMLQSMPPWR